MGKMNVHRSQKEKAATMITLRPSRERGHAQHGWLDSYHTFSFADYYDPAHMGFRDLRVINEDRVQPGKGFATHAHTDMEIISYVLEGALEHKDSLGTGSVIRPGDVQRMTAGTGVRHSEYNQSKSDLVHFLQIWILPERTGLQPGYEQKHFPDAEKHNALRLIASRQGRDGSVTIHQDVDVYAAVLDSGASVTHRLQPQRHAWVQAARGSLTLNEQRLDAGDGAAVSAEPVLGITAAGVAEILLFDLA
jgi:redox-sensitive bicupin YhaK (pirin superfamily)